MTKRVEVKTCNLKAAFVAAPKNDSRYYLNGIFIDAKEGKIKSTDGRTLCIIEDKEVKKFKKSVFIKYNIIELILKENAKNDDTIFFVEDDGLSIFDFFIKFEDDIVFPKTEKIENINKDDFLNVSVMNESLCIDFKYIKRLADTQRALKISRPVFKPKYITSKTGHRDGVPFLFEFGVCKFYIMPIRF